MARTNLIYGPPGTGKTTKLMRIVDTLKEYTSPDEIGFVTFTRAGAGEALARMGIKKSRTVRTLHSLAFACAGLSSEQVVTTQKLQRFGVMIGMPIIGHTMGTGTELEIGDELMTILQYARARDMSPAEASVALGSMHSPAIAESFARSYAEWKRRGGLHDFDDMIDSFIAHPKPLGVRYLIVDEGQDLSPRQWQMVTFLAQEAEGVWVAGDDDQSIFTWAGADPHGMAEFGERNGAGVEVLSQSHRIPASVHRMASALIRKVARRQQKVYRPRSEEGAIMTHQDVAAVPLSASGSILVLYRNHGSRRELEDWIIRNRLPYTANGPLRSAFDSRWAMGLRAWNALQAGREISQPLYQALLHAAPRLAEFFERRDMSFLKGSPWKWFKGCPDHWVDYLMAVDLFAEPRVRISTIHASKGQQADQVVLLNSMGARTENESYSSQESQDAETRVWYVGLTRAKHRLDIIQDHRPFDLI